MKATVTILTSFVLVLGLSGVASATIYGLDKSETFDTPASAAANGWAQGTYGTNPVQWQVVDSSNAGGDAQEIGGASIRGLSPSGESTRYYADTTVGVLTDADTFEASGKMYRNKKRMEEINGFGYGVGISNGNSVLPFVGWIHRDDYASIQKIALYIVADDGTGVMQNIERTWIAFNQIDWTLKYDHTTRKLSGTLNSESWETAALPADKHFTLDLFGIYQVANNSDVEYNDGTVYYDNVSYSVPEPASAILLLLGLPLLARRRRS
jgi:hypothetical protein